MTIHSMVLWIPGIALILLGILYMRKGMYPPPEPYRRSAERSTGAAEKNKTANLTAGIAFVIAGIILIVFFAAVPSLLEPF